MYINTTLDYIYLYYYHVTIDMDILSHLIPMAITLTSNASYPIINIPATLTPILGPTTTTTTPAPAAQLLDASTISGIVALATAGYASVKEHLGSKKQEKRDSSVVTALEKTVNSLKNSDYAAHDDIKGVNALVMKLAENPDIAKLLETPTDLNHGIGGKSVMQYVKEQTEEWEKSNKEYYENTTPIETDTDKDLVIRKTGEIAKETTPTLN